MKRIALLLVVSGLCTACVGSVLKSDNEAPDLYRLAAPAASGGGAGPSLAQAVIGAVAPVCPIDPSPLIEGREARGGIINPNLDPASRPEWPEAFWLLQNKTRQSYTLEAASDFPLETRVRALVAGVNAALAMVAKQNLAK